MYSKLQVLEDCSPFYIRFTFDKLDSIVQFVISKLNTLRIRHTSGYSHKDFPIEISEEIISLLPKNFAFQFLVDRVSIFDTPPGGGHHLGPHTDNADNRYSARLHVPILSNSGCIHEWYAEPEDYKCHIPADGSAYMFRTNILHDTYNHGTEDRYHLIAEVYDTNHVVPGFEYNFIDEIKSQTKKEIEFYLGEEKARIFTKEKEL